MLQNLFIERAAATRMLRTKCIHLPVSAEDGYRISVMSRHTLNDGITPDPRITETSFNGWWKALAPPVKLLGDYYKRGMPFATFQDRYRDFLLNDAAPKMKLKELVWYAMRETTTILCAETDYAQCHRLLIAEECKRLQPDLEVLVS